jgi:hypothetical protein
VILVCGVHAERGKARPDTVFASVRARGSAAGSRNCEPLSTDAGCAGGPARSSAEAPVMGVEPRGRTIRVGEAVNRREPGGAG